MRSIFSNILILLNIIILITIFNTPSYSNNLAVSNISFGNRNPASSVVAVQFDVSWENSWKTKINHDAIWLTVRLHNPSVSPTDKKLCQLSASGLNPTGASAGTNTDIELYIPDDRMGAFLRSKSFGVKSSVSSTAVQLSVNYSSCGFAETDNVYASVMGIEMVLVPESPFYAGDYNGSTASLHQGTSDPEPWYVSSANSIPVTDATTNGFRYVSNGNAGEDLTGATFSIPEDFPNGFSAFYAMKYEITEGQWAEFINSLPSVGARANRDLTDSAHKNSDTVKFRNTLSCSGSPLTCATERPYRALSYLSWMDLAAFLDWAALRPMTELEFEKMARGPLLAVAGEFTWGSTNITAAVVISGNDEVGTETVTTIGANAHYNNSTFSGGDSSRGADYAQGPLRSGIFATGNSSRNSSGAGYYGIMDLSGNVKERVVTIGNSSGRNFDGTHGDGVLSTASGFEGNASNTTWPGIDATVARGVTGSSGSGLRGGAWDDQASGARLRISDRHDAANASVGATSSTGGRGVRTVDE